MAYAFVKTGASARLTASLLALGLLLTGCGLHPYEEPKLPDAVPDAIIDPAPVAIGVHYGDALRNHSCRAGERACCGQPGWIIEMGPRSIEMFDGLLADMFRETETVAELPQDTLMHDDRDVVEIRMTDFTGCLPSTNTSSAVTAVYEAIAYEAILWSAQGQELTRWQGRGSAGSTDPYRGYMTSSDEAGRQDALTRIAMRKAATHFLYGFDSNPVVQSRLYGRTQLTTSPVWWRNPEVEPGPRKTDEPEPRKTRMETKSNAEIIEEYRLKLEAQCKAQPERCYGQ